ncbi:MAG: SPOR domain-containing protein [Gemmatimonadetes bacterium]|nr:SPOR domain-containing protein [Gemmatimonadota bacterium]
MRVRITLSILLAAVLIPFEVVGQTNDEMRYSVQIASLGSMQLALDAGRQWATPDMPVYVVPVEVQGRTYYRVMAGLLSTQQEASALMNDLVARGIKESANAWDVRDTNLAFALDAYPSEAEAQRARDQARSTGIPAYVIPVEENGALEYWTWAGGFANGGEALVLQNLLTRQGENPPLLRRMGLNPAAARTLADRLAQQAAADLAREAEMVEEAPPAEEPPAEEAPPPAEEAPPAEQAPPPTQEPPAQEAPPPAQEEEAPAMPAANPAPDAAIPPTSTDAGSANFTSIFIGAVGTATAFASAPSVSAPMGYGGAIIAGILLGGIVEIGGHGGAEYVSQDGAFGTTAATATVLSYSAFGGLYTPALGVGGVSFRLGGRGGWSSGQVRVSVDDLSATADLETGVFVEPVLKVGSGSLRLIGAFRYFLDDTSAADWTGSLGVVWGT